MGQISENPEEKYKFWFYTEVGARIKKYRKLNNESQDDLASALNISRVSMVNIESGKQRMPAYILSDICYFLRIGVEDLIPKRDEYEK